MKKIKVLLQVTLVMLLVLSCSKNEEVVSLNEKNNFSYYVKKSQNVKKISDDAIFEIKKLSSKGVQLSDSEVTSLLFDYIEKNDDNNELYGITYKDYQQINSINPETIALNESGLSTKALSYFTQLENLNKNEDYQGMVTLLDKYKSEYDSDPHLESLASVFSIIELHKNDLLVSKYQNRECISGSALGGAAISGAISGAIWGFKLGSWLGPAGTALGTLGGAIAGATISTIVSIGVQSVRC